ncbi:hypothetical protein Nepgr_022211 [Nepenthes gracilis]|uniref:Cation/H+ exchanger domain-containing protein n=1 Tax=Nepenthes gracilis TaxID=150966 RepID=A0AAD3XXZ1_NEPGR|nr:hypothetical protein Nepgr_022211 [Nepenthes gracilis]
MINGGQSGLVLCPSILNMISGALTRQLWPEKGMTNLETLANLGLVYVMFFKGLEMDLTPITRRGKKTLGLTVALIFLPFAIGCALHALFSKGDTADGTSGNGVFMYWGSVVAATSFPTLAPILARLKLLCTDIGRDALSVGMISDLCSWFLVVVVIALSATPPTGQSTYSTTFLVLLFTVLFMVFCMGVIRPLIMRIIKGTPDGENCSDSTIHTLLFMVLACGLVTEFFGAYSLLGAFMMGMCIPQSFLATILVEKMEDCVLGVLMPLYFAMVAIQTNTSTLFSKLNLAVIFLAALVKPLCGLFASFFCGIPHQDGIALGLLLGAKGLLPVVIISIGYERQHLSKEAYSTLLLVILLSTMIVGPTMALVYKKMMRKSLPYQQRTIEGAQANEDFRVIACIHAPRNIPSIINVLEISNVSPHSPMSVFALHLVELIGRASAMHIVHDSSSSSSWGGSANTFFSRKRAQSDQIITAFESYEQLHSTYTSVQTLTVVSPVDTMHEDICSLAEDKQTALILLPFHKQQGMDGKLEDSNEEFRAVNQNVMGLAPCSVGLLVDRGIGMLSLSATNPSSNSVGVSSRSNRQQHAARVAMIYVGGPDDREALSYAWRMAAHPIVSLTVIRLVVGENAVEVEPMDFPGDDEAGILTILTQSEREKEIDEEFVSAFQKRIPNDDDSIVYTEKVSNSGEETVSLLREMEHDYDLYVVGRGQSVLSPLTVGLVEWSECPELGAVGDVLVTSDFAAHVSVLVVQQYAVARPGANGKKASDVEAMPF